MRDRFAEDDRILAALARARLVGTDHAYIAEVVEIEEDPVAPSLEFDHFEEGKGGEEAANDLEFPGPKARIEPDGGGAIGGEEGIGQPVSRAERVEVSPGLTVWDDLKLRLKLFGQTENLTTKRHGLGSGEVEIERQMREYSAASGEQGPGQELSAISAHCRIPHLERYPTDVEDSTHGANLPTWGPTRGESFQEFPRLGDRSTGQLAIDPVR